MIVRIRSAVSMVVMLSILFIGFAANLCGGDISTLAGTGQGGNNGNQGNATRVHVAQPFGVEIGPAGALYVTEVGNHRIMRVDRKTNQLTTIAGTGKAGYSGNREEAMNAVLREPYELRFAKNGDIYFVEMKNHIVRKIEALTNTVRLVAGIGTAGFGGDGGAATAAALNNPHSIALDDQGFLYIADIGNHRIRRVNLETGIIDTIAGTGEKKLPTNESLARGNAMLGPRALYHNKGMLWIALREGHSVWSLNLKSGRLQHIAGTGEKGFTGDTGAPLQATFNGPKGIAVGPQGRLFVVDTENQAIRMIDLKQNVISTVCGFGPQGRGSGGDGSDATKAQMGRPHGICVDANGVVYVGDTMNHRVRFFTAPNVTEK
jgi:sugar lactone lactonase YvrE